MTPQEWTDVLTQTLDDRHLSRSERKALTALLADERPNRRERAQIRHLAFALARDRMTDPRFRELLDWLEDTVKVLDADRSDPPAAEAHFSPGQDCVQRVVSLFDHAQQRVDVCVYTITDDRITDAMLAAHQRGVTLRVITDDEKAYDLGSDIQRLREGGVAVRVDGSEHLMHHKFALFDSRRLLTGSFNWTRSATKFNQENVVVLGDPRLVRAFADTFESLWKQFEP
jgi:phosphatidylserine/phosphatidylglycerophosphate/cardiolipin synthase-like enzyme